MPMYEFKCGECGQEFEDLVFSSNYSPEDIKCPACSASKPERKISAAAVGVSSRSNGGSCSSGYSSGFC
ncbi:zinc ribbon domain-containing protein [candidate division KSB1 bacterium]|nr:zinc ribbon domain-containing protein [candidate division KSB1 bacterium]